MRKPSIRSEVLRLLTSMRMPMAVNEFAICMPGTPVKSIRNTVNKLLADRQIHAVNRYVLHPQYALGAPPSGQPQSPETVEERQEREYRLRTNEHLRPEWTPAPDPVAVAWMLTPIPMEEPNHVE